MFSTLSTLLVAGLALKANAFPNGDLVARQVVTTTTSSTTSSVSTLKCPAQGGGNGCDRFVTGTNARGVSQYPPSARATDCMSFLLTTVSGCAGTTTETAAAVLTTSTVTVSQATTTVIQQTIVNTATSSEFTTTTVTSSRVFNKMAKRVPGPSQGTTSATPVSSCSTVTMSATAVPMTATNACPASSAYSRACACYLSSMSLRTSTIAVSTATSTFTPTNVVIEYSTVVSTAVTTSATTTTTVVTTTNVATAVATVQPVSGQFFVQASDGTSLVAGSAPNYEILSDTTNSALYFITDAQGALKDASNAYFANTAAGGTGAVNLVNSGIVNPVHCECANYIARTGAFTCRSSTGATVLELCGAAGSPRALQINSVATGGNCSPIVAECKPAAAST